MLKQFCFQHDNEEGNRCKPRTEHWITMDGLWCSGAYSRALWASIFPWNGRVWNKTEMAGRGQLMGLSTQPTLLWVYCFSVIFCVRMCCGVYFWPREHTCVCVYVCARACSLITQVEWTSTGSKIRLSLLQWWTVTTEMEGEWAVWSQGTFSGGPFWSV